jgi:hypothetical protein
MSVVTNISSLTTAKTDYPNRRKLIKLSGGALISCYNDTTNGSKLFRSVDGGVTWNEIGSLSTSYKSLTIDAFGDEVIAACYAGLRVYVLRFTPDGTNFGDLIENSKVTIITDEQTAGAYQAVTMAVDASRSTAHVAWCSHVGSNNNKYNLRYRSVTLQTGNTFWAMTAKESITNDSTYTYFARDPYITVDNLGIPVITFLQDAVVMTGSSTIYDMDGVVVVRRDKKLSTNSDLNSSNWTTNSITYGGLFSEWNSAPILYIPPSVSGTANGKFMVTMASEADTVGYVAVSTDYGATWSLTSTNNMGITDSPRSLTLTCDKNNDVTLFYEAKIASVSSTYYNIGMVQLKNGTSSWTSETAVTSYTNRNARYAAPLFDSTFDYSNSPDDVPPLLFTSNGVYYAGTQVSNLTPTLTVTTEDNQVLYEGSSYVISGSASDADADQTVSVYYQIDDSASRAIATGLSSEVLNFNKTLTFSNGALYDGTTAVISGLVEDTQYSLKVKAIDSIGSVSIESVLNFTVVLNRAPVLTVNTIESTATLNSDVIPVSGTCSDEDGDNITVTYQINSDSAVQVYSGTGGSWSFDLPMSSLQTGENTITIIALDSKNFSGTKTFTITKFAPETALLQSTVRYRVLPQNATTTGIIVWVRRHKNLTVSAEACLMASGGTESYASMTLDSTTNIDEMTVEDQFTYENAEGGAEVLIKLNLTRESTSVSDKVTLISGVLE